MNQIQYPAPHARLRREGSELFYTFHDQQGFYCSWLFMCAILKLHPVELAWRQRRLAQLIQVDRMDAKSALQVVVVEARSQPWIDRSQSN